MSTLILPYQATAGQAAPSASYNANNAAITTWANGSIDNTNIGSAGIFASQIKPLTAAEATFGATAAGVGYKFLANDITAVPLTVSGVSGQSADVFDVTLTSGGTYAFQILASGDAVFGYPAVFDNVVDVAALVLTAPASSIGSSAAVAIVNDGQLPRGMIFNVPSGSTYGYRFQANESTVATISATGVLTALTLVASAASGGANYVMQFPSGLSSGTTGIAAGGGSVAGVSGTALHIDNYAVSTLLAVDASGNLGVAGALVAAKTVQGSSNSSTITYLGPTYTAAGGAIASTYHSAAGQVTASGSTTTLSLSGAAAFSTALTRILISDLSTSPSTYVGISNTTTLSSIVWASTNGHIYAYEIAGY